MDKYEHSIREKLQKVDKLTMQLSRVQKDKRETTVESIKDLLNQVKSDLEKARDLCKMNNSMEDSRIRDELRRLAKDTMNKYKSVYKPLKHKWLQEVDQVGRDEPLPSSTMPMDSRTVVYEDDSGKEFAKNKEIEEELFKEVFDLQNESLNVLKRMVKKSDDIREVNEDSLQTIKEQAEELRQIDQEIDLLGGNIQLARKEFAAFARRLATDKLIVVMCLCSAIISIIILLVIVACRFGVCALIKKLIEKGKDVVDPGSGSGSERQITSNCASTAWGTVKQLYQATFQRPELAEFE